MEAETINAAKSAARGELARFRTVLSVTVKAPEIRIRPMRGAAYLAGALITP